MAERGPRRVIAIDRSRAVDEPDNHLRQSVLVTAAEHGPDVSATWVAIDGRRRRLRTLRSTRLYAGTGEYLVINAPAFVAGDDEYDAAP